MSLEIKGSIVQVCTPQRTPKKDGSGDFVQQMFIIETDGQYPKKVALLIKGEERVNNFDKYNSVGQVVNVKVEAESREYNGKWYTDLTAWRIDSVNENAPKQAPQPVAQSPTQSSVPLAEGDKDNLLF